MHINVLLSTKWNILPPSPGIHSEQRHRASDKCAETSKWAWTGFEKNCWPLFWIQLFSHSSTYILFSRKFSKRDSYSSYLWIFSKERSRVPKVIYYYDPWSYFFISFLVIILGEYPFLELYLSNFLSWLSFNLNCRLHLDFHYFTNRASNFHILIVRACKMQYWSYKRSSINLLVRNFRQGNPNCWIEIDSKVSIVPMKPRRKGLCLYP